jgi:hypothetical protein
MFIRLMTDNEFERRVRPLNNVEVPLLPFARDQQFLARIGSRSQLRSTSSVQYINE